MTNIAHASENSFNLFSVGWHASAHGWHIRMHQHTLYEMIVIASGQEKVRLANREFTAMTGDVLLFPPGTAHEEWTSSATGVESFFLTFASQKTEPDWPIKTIDANGRLRLLVSWIYAERNTTFPENQAACAAFFNAIILEFIRMVQRPGNPLVVQIRAHIHNHIDTPLTLDALATQAGMSKFHFIRRYQQLTGHTPMEDARRIRLEHARDLLLTTTLPVKAIAPMSGLGDTVSLYRLFRKYFHITPWQLRRTTRRK